MLRDPFLKFICDAGIENSRLTRHDIHTIRFHVAAHRLSSRPKSRAFSLPARSAGAGRSGGTSLPFFVVIFALCPALPRVLLSPLIALRACHPDRSPAPFFFPARSAGAGRSGGTSLPFFVVIFALCPDALPRVLLSPLIALRVRSGGPPQEIPIQI